VQTDLVGLRSEILQRKVEWFDIPVDSTLLTGANITAAELVDVKRV